jgi:dTDP-glucose pyrophosphorylase
MRQMSELGEKELYVIDQERMLVGSLTDSDIRKWILKEGSLEVAVENVCNRSPHTVTEGFRKEDVKEWMMSLGIGTVPLLNARKQVEAVLTWEEIFAGKQKKVRSPLGVPVVIMAGGKGSRLDPFTTILPKSLIPIGEKSILELIMDKFAEYDVKDFYLSVFHKARMIRAYFEEKTNQYALRYVEEKKPLGTVGALGLLKGDLKGTFLVTNCDIIIDADYAELVSFHREHGYDLTLVVSMRHYVIPYGVCELGNGGVLKGIKEKPEHDLLISTGMYVMNNKLLGLIPDGESFDIIQLIAAAKAQGMTVGLYPISEKAWIDIGQWEEYHKAVQRLRVE